MVINAYLPSNLCDSSDGSDSSGSSDSSDQKTSLAKKTFFFTKKLSSPKKITKTSLNKKLKSQIVMKLKNSNCDDNQKLKL